jgi:hypothetical protein
MKQVELYGRVRYPLIQLEVHGPSGKSATLAFKEPFRLEFTPSIQQLLIASFQLAQNNEVNEVGNSGGVRWGRRL